MLYNNIFEIGGFIILLLVIYYIFDPIQNYSVWQNNSEFNILLNQNNDNTNNESIHKWIYKWIVKRYLNNDGTTIVAFR